MGRIRGENAPDWRDRVRADVAALPERRSTIPRDSAKYDVDVKSGARGLLNRAAAARRLSVSAYLRRAGFAMAAYDLGVPLSDFLTFDPRMARETGLAVADPEGHLFGRWEIESLKGDEDEPL